MAKSLPGQKNATRKIRSGFFGIFGSGAATNFVFGVLRGFGMALGFSGVAVAVVFLSAIVSQIPFVANILRFFGINI
jgi:threonine/homoserine/homoserine lactone efflux protein